MTKKNSYILEPVPSREVLRENIHWTEYDSFILTHTGLLGYKFIGVGWYESNDEQNYYKEGTTMKECLEYCQVKRVSEGGEWNGVRWRVSDGLCSCVKNDQGHEDVSDWLHFRAQ